ncbi:MAG: hypothetical protein KC729_21015 [Candidatus Eisenbacteria bacterium]|uniref:Uncharacterized protein n=1 Tax=Eiseniibacteriota bacterium TaxID=2212470 RepID=A0A956M328_UNCEI|nr:hypothetical protein [Candidatus Eisenbacteria bacterium]
MTELLRLCALLALTLGPLAWCFAEAFEMWMGDTASRHRGVGSSPPLGPAPHVRKVVRPYDWEQDV